MTERGEGAVRGVAPRLHARCRHPLSVGVRVCVEEREGSREGRGKREWEIECECVFVDLHICIHRHTLRRVVGANITSRGTESVWGGEAETSQHLSRSHTHAHITHNSTSSSERNKTSSQSDSSDTSLPS